MKFAEILEKILNIILSIINRRSKKERKEIENEIDELERKYKEALKKGDVRSIVYYRQLIDLRLRDPEL